MTAGTLDGEAVEAIALLAARAEQAGQLDAEADDILPAGVTLRIVDNRQRVERVDIEALHPTPREHRGGAELHDGPSFASYVTRLATDTTTLWAQPPASAAAGGTVVAVFNDHKAGQPGWRDHRATLRVQLDPDWRDWTSIDGKLMDQKAFAQFLLDHQHTIGDPPPARLMPAVLQFQAARNASYESSVNLDNGEVRLSYVEEIKNNNKGKQTVALPQVITLGLFPFVGAVEDTEAYPVEARVRYQVPNDGGPLQIGVKLTRPDYVVRQAWDRLCADLRDNIPDVVPLLQGAAPAALRG
jgi:uncharacterized protein YfdQ (DUF2303 family)